MTTLTKNKPFMISKDNNVVIYHVIVKTNGMGVLKTNHGLIPIQADGFSFYIGKDKYNTTMFKLA